MEYLVLARKWRPQVFESVVGQDHVVKTLKNAIKYNRIAHALIFSGPRGVGKTSVARILAKAINCVHGPAEIPCNECTNCKEITAGLSLDVREIDGASNRGIDEIRELRENIKFAPSSSRHKVYIIDEVHMLTKEAFNALLKTLEEPPPHVIFMFATTEIHKVPSTILSRCQHFDFRRVSIRQIADNLRQIATTEKINVSDTGLMWIARAGEGSMRDAQSIFDQVISYAGTDMKNDDIEELLGLKDRRLLIDISKAVLERNAGDCLKIINEGYYSGVDMKQFYQMLLNHFMNLLMVKITGNDNLLVDLADDELSTLGEQVEGTSRETLQRLLDILMAEEEDIKRSLDPRLNLEFVLVRMAYLEPMIPVDEILSKMEHLEKKLSSQEGNKRRGMPPDHDLAKFGSHPKVRKGKTDEEIPGEHFWVNYKHFVKKKSPLLWSKIEPGTFLSFKNKCLEIGFPEGYIFLEDIAEKSQMDRLVDISQEFFRDDIKILIQSLKQESEEHNRVHSPDVNNGRKKNNIKNEALKHPLVQKVMDVFEGAELHDVISKVKD
ncbi:MAG: DNA polymerase III subunit gamma/tau [Deltaproteobacteria bacterium]|nr:DNA polymerase III subunit gamma/tau [Deltaproteobacteria bacterium]